MTHYTQHAKVLFTKYSQMKSAELHADWIKHLPDRPGLACDIGAGSGRDANRKRALRTEFTKTFPLQKRPDERIVA